MHKSLRMFVCLNFVLRVSRSHACIFVTVFERAQTLVLAWTNAFVHMCACTRVHVCLSKILERIMKAIFYARTCVTQWSTSIQERQECLAGFCEPHGVCACARAHVLACACMKECWRDTAADLQAMLCKCGCKFARRECVRASMCETPGINYASHSV